MNSKRPGFFLRILILAAASLPGMPVAAAPAGEISGTVKVRGVRTSADVVISLERTDGADQTPAPSPQRVVMDQQNISFVPHVLPVVKGASVDFPNSDKVRHNVYSPEGSPKQFNLGTYPVGVTKTMDFDSAGVIPLHCNVHAEMSAFILVLETPYFATTDKYGRFSIPGVPPGKYLLRAWHEKVNSVEQEVTVSAGNPVTVQLEMSGRK